VGEAVTRKAKEKPASNSSATGMWTDRAKQLRVITHPVRLMILDALSKGTQCVKDLNLLIKIDQPRLSQHMAALRRAEMVASHSNGPLRCYYLLRPVFVKKLMGILRLQHSPRFRKRANVVKEVQSKAKT